jgi:hypothetical protein
MYLLSVVAQSFQEVLRQEKTNKKRYAKKEFMKKREERSKRRVWKFQGDREEERHQYVQRAIGKIRFCESVL